MCWRGGPVSIRSSIRPTWPTRRRPADRHGGARDPHRHRSAGARRALLVGVRYFHRPGGGRAVLRLFVFYNPAGAVHGCLGRLAQSAARPVAGGARARDRSERHRAAHHAAQGRVAAGAHNRQRAGDGNAARRHRLDRRGTAAVREHGPGPAHSARRNLRRARPLQARGAAPHRDLDGRRAPEGGGRNPEVTAPKHRFLIIADGDFGPLTSKTANSCSRYLPDRIVAAFGRTQAGKTAQPVLGFGGNIPVVGNFEQGLNGATAVLVGIAPAGGRLPEEWKTWLNTAINRKLEIWSGLHTFIGDDPELGSLAKAKGVRIFDARKPPPNLPIADGRAAEVDALVVLAVGSDCNVGKMTAQLQLRDALAQRGARTSFVATGQTGIFIEGWGIAVDAVVADFIAGAAEQLVLQAAKDNDIVLVEGQGSLIHPGYSGVTLGLLHGSCPDALILCHQVTRDYIGDYHGREPWVRISSYSELIEIHERAAQPVHPTKVIGISLNTYDMDENAAREAVAKAAEETGLPATDPVRFDADVLVDAIIGARATI